MTAHLGAVTDLPPVSADSDEAGELAPLRGFLVGKAACHLGLTPQALRDRPFGAG